MNAEHKNEEAGGFASWTADSRWQITGDPSRSRLSKEQLEIDHSHWCTGGLHDEY